MNKKEYNEILSGVYKRAEENKRRDNFKQEIKNLKYSELRKKLKEHRLNHWLTDSEVELEKAVLINEEMTKRILNN